jgi:6-phosphogluconolactonase
LLRAGSIYFEVEENPSGGLTPRNFNLDPAGRSLPAANQDSGNGVVFSIDEKSGRPTPNGQRVTLEKPVCIVFVPTI